ncbi:hypothetical protein [Aquipuribacter nitratireducens]|uniref:DUF2157 domain-containing protein n=1 Tax=Aquipuribacter nitratireducens TaxID=650104 RepID=A0ABW0GJS4_9MICO
MGRVRSSDTPAIAAPRTGGRREAVDVVVDVLVGHGFVAREDRDAAVRVAREAGTGARSGRRWWAEIAGYVGGALVVAAAVLFVAQEWPDLTRTGRVLVLAVTAVALVATAAGLVASGGGRGAVLAPAEAARRRLVGAVLLGAAAATGFAVGLQVAGTAVGARDADVPPLVGVVTALVVAVAAYVWVPGTVGQLGVAAAAVALVPLALEVVDAQEALPVGMTFLAVGVVVLVVAESGWWWDTTVGRLTGVALVLVGAQSPQFDPEPWPGHLATALVAVAGFALYRRLQQWPYLALGVAGVTLVVPEAALHWTDGSLGVSGGLLLAGLTLLVAAVVGLRLRGGGAAAARG